MSEEYSKLPEELEEIGIEDLQEGEVAYTMPWCIWLKMDRSASINKHSPFSTEEKGTLDMRIKKRASEVLVDMDSLKNSKFSRSEYPPITVQDQKIICQ